LLAYGTLPPDVSVLSNRLPPRRRSLKIITPQRKLIQTQKVEAVTLGDFLGAARSRWWITLLGAGLTAGLISLPAHIRPVYWAETTVVFLAPPSLRDTNALTDSRDTLLSAAGVVERIVDKGDPGLWTASSSVKLFDQGVYDGQLIKLPDTGGQWSHNFETSALQVQVTGIDPIEVRERLGRAVATIRSTMDALQVEANVRKSQYIETQVTESSPTVFRVGGSRARVLAISLAIGLMVTLWMFIIADRVTKVQRGRFS
jgi:hypothetical protein